MLTMEAFHERRWGQYPNLSQLLSGNQPSVQWHGPTSVSSNIFNQVEDLLHVYALVADQAVEVRKQCFKSDDQLLKCEIQTLSEQLQGMSEYFKEASNRVQKIYMY